MTQSLAAPRAFLIQAPLDVSVRAIETGDFDLYLTVNAVPSVLVGDSGTEVLADIAAVRRNFDELRGLLGSHGGIRLVRRVIAERPAGGAMMEATVETEFLRTGRAVADPLLTLMVWRLTGTGWQCTCVVNPVRARRAALAEGLRPALPGRGVEEN